MYVPLNPKPDFQSSVQFRIDWMTVEPKEPSKGIKSKFVSGVKFASRTAEGWDLRFRAQHRIG